MRLKFLAALCLFALPAFSQISAETSSGTRYSATTTSSLASSASTTVTLQQPAAAIGATGNGTVTNSQMQIHLESFTAQCVGQPFDVLQSQNGSAATATASAQTPALGSGPLASAVFYSASNSTGGYLTMQTLSWPAGSIAAVPLTGVVLGATGPGSNYSFTITNTGAASCTLRASFVWSETI